MENFTQKEQEIFTLMAEGLSNDEIAKRLYISIHTVKTHLLNIYEKTGIHNRIQLIILAVKMKYNIED